MAPTIDDLRARFAREDKAEPDADAKDGTCPRCHGRGIVHPSQPGMARRCYHCRGTGSLGGVEPAFNLDDYTCRCGHGREAHARGGAGGCAAENCGCSAHTGAGGPMLRANPDGSTSIRIPPVPHLEGSGQRLAGLPVSGVVGTTTELERALQETLALRLQPWVGSRIGVSTLAEINTELKRILADLREVCTISMDEVLGSFRMDAAVDANGRLNVRVEKRERALALPLLEEEIAADLAEDTAREDDRVDALAMAIKKATIPAGGWIPPSSILGRYKK